MTNDAPTTNGGGATKNGPLPPKSRSGMSLRDVVSKMNAKGGGDGSAGLTLSESIRNSGKVLEEHEMKIRQLNNLTETLTNKVKTKEEEMLAMQAAMQERLDKKSKEVEQLQSTARASEMAIRGLEDEVRLLRKQNNEVERVFRAQAGQRPSEREPAPPLTRKPSAPGLLSPRESRPATRDVDAGMEALQGQLRAAELLIKQQKKPIDSGEADALGLRAQVADLRNKNTLLDKEKVPPPPAT
jgi:myosin heavy subunit